MTTPTPDDIGRLVSDALEALGGMAADKLIDVRSYTAERTAYLSTIVGQPGFDEAVTAEAHSVALRAGVAGVDAADAADQRLFAVVVGLISIGARAV